MRPGLDDSTAPIELIRQDIEPLLALWPDAPAGINSAGIGRREWDAPIVFAGVQSVWRNAARLETISCRDGVHLLGSGLPGLMDSIRRCRTGG